MSVSMIVPLDTRSMYQERSWGGVNDGDELGFDDGFKVGDGERDGTFDGKRDG